jgi:hypothetical protein
MAMKVKVQEHEILPADTYDATFKDVEEANSPTGEFWLWTFEISHDGKQQPMTAASSPKLTRQTKAGLWVAAIREQQVDPGEEFDFAMIQGKPCRLVIVIDDTERGKFNKVDRVTPPRQEQAQRSDEALF